MNITTLNKRIHRLTIEKMVSEAASWGDFLVQELEEALLAELDGLYANNKQKIASMPVSELKRKFDYREKLTFIEFMRLLVFIGEDERWLMLAHLNTLINAVDKWEKKLNQKKKSTKTKKEKRAA